mgnify:CR=1 FL=1
MDEIAVIRMWITNKINKKVTTDMSDSMIEFLSCAVENGCTGSTFAEDDERIIVYTMWSNEATLEQFRSSQDYKILEEKIINSYVSAGFEIPSDILFNSTAKILFRN